ncbi:MAG: Protein TolB [Phycisphaerae bacterium]|nr:Protein TolB [Phycisphaerae bacterium]
MTLTFFRDWLSRVIILCGLLLVTAVTLADEPATPPPADETARENELISNGRRLTFEGARAGEGYFSPDGKQMVFPSEREADNPFLQMYLLDLETGDTQRLSPGIGKTTCAFFHPSGKKLLFSSTHEDPEATAKQQAELEKRKQGTPTGRYAGWDFDDQYEIYELDLATHQFKRLTNSRGYDAEAAYSPDGTQIVFASNRSTYEDTISDKDKEIIAKDPSYMMDLYIMNADGTNVRRLTRERGYDGGPFFSPDGRRICWRHFADDGATAEIRTANTDGSDLCQLTSLGVMSWAPYYHPSGEYLIFTTNKHGFDNFELYLVDVAGEHEPVRVTYTPRFDGLPIFSWDGKTLTWTSSRGGLTGGQIFIGQWNHEKARELLKQAPLRQVPRASTREVSEFSSTFWARRDAGIDSTPVTTDPAIRAEDLRQYIETLASSAMDGRLTGTPGEKMATDYVAAQFQRLGLQPAGDNGTYFQEFSFTAGANLGPENKLSLTIGEPSLTFTIDQDWRPLAFSQTGTYEPAGVIFAGYGIVAPKNEHAETVDAFVDLDVKDKWVLVFRYMPENIKPELRQQWSRYSGLRYKAMLARDKGARGLLIVTGPKAQANEQLVKLAFDAGLSGTSIPCLSISDDLAQKLLDPSGKKLAELQATLDSGEVTKGWVVPGVQLSATVDIQKEEKIGRNVIARLPATESDKSLASVMVGAHVDHLGRGVGSNSMARDDEKGDIHYGADDNASGVAAMIEIAEYLVDQQKHGKLPLQHDVLFAAWSGEELGLLGSAHYVNALTGNNPHAKLQDQIAAYLNMDMVGRLQKEAIINGLNSSTIWGQLIERANTPVGLALTTNEDSIVPTDATSFYLKNVPILSVWTGAHEDYHTPRDTADKINYDGAEKIARFIGLITRALAIDPATPEFVEAPIGKEAGATRANLRAYLGSIPDFAKSDVKGVALSGVTKGAPADKAGLLSGDIIIELAGRKIENIYDYTYAIEALKIDEPVQIVIQRGAETLTLTITPAARE